MLRSFLVFLTKRLPLRRISSGRDEFPYLERYYLAGPFPEEIVPSWKGDVPKVRLGWLKHTWYIHKFYRPDQGDYLHNHPGESISMPLVGGYWELYFDGPEKERAYRWRGPFKVRKIGTDEFHHIESLGSVHKPLTEVWTLFGAGPRVQEWGFWVDGELVPWREHIAKRVKEGQPQE